MIPEHEQRLDKLMIYAFDTNHPAMHDWILTKMELRELRLFKIEVETTADESISQG